MLEDLTGLSSKGSDRKEANPKDNWRPHLELDADGGYFVSTPRKPDQTADHTELLREFNLDPKDWVVTNVRRSKWQTYHGEWLEAFRVTLLPRAARASLIDASQLEKEIRAWRPKKTDKATKGDLTAVYCLGDTQYGKDAGDGTDGTVSRVLSALQSAQQRHKEIKDRGIGQIALPQLGDCIEGVVSQGGKIAGRLDLDLTTQIRVGRRMLLQWVKAFAPLTDDLVIPVVPGNHDESHRQLITDPVDSWQVEIVQQVLDIARENPSLQHVTGRFPSRDNSTLTVNLSGTWVGMAHGHQARDLVKWWYGQSMGRTDVGLADVLLTGHYHHYKVQQVGANLWVQIPSLDGGSAWFRDRQGLDSPPGLVSLVVGAGYDPRRDLVVLT
jgi:predicted phosphodiesterase